MAGVVAPDKVQAPQKSVSAPFNANAVVQAYAQPFGIPSHYKGTPDKPEFPTQLYSPDARDKYYATMPEALASMKRDGSPNVVYNASTADVAYFADKADAQANGEFKAFMMAQMDLTKPESQAYWRSVAPEIFQERLNIVTTQHELSKRLAQINIVGPQSMEDFAVIWGIQTGRIQAPPEKALWRPETYKDWDKKEKSGLFNTFLWGTKDSAKQTIKGGEMEWHAPVGGFNNRNDRWGKYTNTNFGGLPF